MVLVLHVSTSHARPSFVLTAVAMCAAQRKPEAERGLQDFLVMPADLPAPARASAGTTPVATTAVTDTVSRERRKMAEARASAASKSGLVIPPPPVQPGLAAADYAQARPKPPTTVAWEMPAAWPTEAADAQPIKLPRQNKVTQVRCSSVSIAIACC